jgi:hypothetical protein
LDINYKNEMCKQTVRYRFDPEVISDVEFIMLTSFDLWIFLTFFGEVGLFGAFVPNAFCFCRFLCSGTFESTFLVESGDAAAAVVFYAEGRRVAPSWTLRHFENVDGNDR